MPEPNTSFGIGTLAHRCIAVCLAVLVCSLLVGISPAAAQTATAQLHEDDVSPVDTARFHWGALHFTPSLSLNNLGTDSNVYNESDNPQRDTTASFGPAVDLAMNVGRSLLTGRVSGQYVYYTKFDSQRSLNSADTLQWEFPLGRFRPFIIGDFNTTRNRRSYEIDSRPRQIVQSAGGGVSLRVSAKTSVEAYGGRGLSEYKKGESFLDTDLAASLNHSTNDEGLRFRYKWTPLTTFVFDAQALQDRFFYNPLRDADSVRLLPGFDFKPAALISGRVYVGYRELTPVNPEVPQYRGVISTVDSSIVNGSRLFNVAVSRDIDFSYQDLRPYYTLTDATLTVTQRVTRTWDVQGRGSFQFLDYRELAGAVETGGREDRIRQYGGGLGYRLGRTFRIGLNAMEVTRRSTDPLLASYSGVRIGVSVDYGLNP